MSDAHEAALKALHDAETALKAAEEAEASAAPAATPNVAAEPVKPVESIDIMLGPTHTGPN